MCGIAGILGGPILSEDALRAMSAAIRSRGPDDSGVWIDPAAGVGFAHARLSIVDLSRAGHQPMDSPSGRYVITYNGEIYNHLAIRRELENSAPNIRWRGHSDTETLVAAFDVWGVKDTLSRTVGMFAFAVWDRAAQTLTLARDRLGEKPLYFGFLRDAFLFGSELKALTAYPGFTAQVDRDALTLLLRHNYIPEPYSIYRGIGKLAPATMLTVSRNSRETHLEQFWDIAGVIDRGSLTPFAGNQDEVVLRLEQLLLDAVKLQLMGDVPVGAFLSGGVDSSTIVALMQASSSQPVRTFTIGFADPCFDEARYARAVAAHLGTEHTELYVSAQQVLDVVPRLPEIYCEPFADSSQIPTYLLSQLTRRSVTVSLSGDGGDELFGGYARYATSDRFWKRLAWVPRPLRAGLGTLIRSTPNSLLTRAFSPFSGLFPEAMQGPDIADRIQKGAVFLSAANSLEWYKLIVSLWNQPTEAIIDGMDSATALTDIRSWHRVQGMFHRMMATDLVSYLPGDILVKVDRAAMSVSLETRVPLLDHRVVEFAWQLPFASKIHAGTGKWPLRRLLDKYVPRSLIERPKMGFGVPLAAWLRGPLREWAEDLLSEERLVREGYFHARVVRKKWLQHLRGDRQWHNQIWTVLMFQAWLQARD